MARNGSGTMTPDVDFTTEAASPPIEISKLDQVLEDIADEITNSIAADGQTNPTANLKMNGFRLTNLGAATALTDAARVSELIDQDHVYYVDSGSANTLVITPSPAIAAYEEGQRFVVRATAANTGATTLNVNGLGAIAVQTPDGSALASGAIVVGGIYEFTYDANTSPDRWVLTSMPSDIPDAMLTSNVVLENVENTFTQLQTINYADGGAPVGGVYTLRLFDSRAVDADHGGSLTFGGTYTGTTQTAWAGIAGLKENSTDGQFGGYLSLYYRAHGGDLLEGLRIGADGNFDFNAGTVTTNKASASEVGTLGVPRVSKSADYTIAAVDSGTELVLTSAADDITVQASGQPAAGCVVFLENGTGGSVDIIQGSGMTLTLDGTATTGSRTLAANGRAYVRFTGSGTASVGGIGAA